MSMLHNIPGRTKKLPPLRVGVGGPVGSGKTTLVEMLCKAMRERWDLVVVTNDIYTKEDQRLLTVAGALEPERIVGVETGGCPHTAIREDASINLEAVDRMLVTDNTVLKMQAFNDREVNALIEKAWGRVRKTPDELNKVIDKTRESLYALGDGYTAWQRYDHNRIDLVADKSTYKPGETAKIMIQSPWERATALVTTEREGVRSHKQFMLTSTQQSIDVAITEEDIPNVYVSVMLIKGRSKASEPEVSGASGGADRREPARAPEENDPSDPGKPSFVYPQARAFGPHKAVLHEPQIEAWPDFARFEGVMAIEFYPDAGSKLLLGTVSTRFPGGAAAFATGAIAGSVLFFFALGYGAGWLRPLFARPGAWRILEGTIAAVMWALALKLAVGG